jgi:glycosyltransferase involved in cell wall biosynthesis
MSIWLDITTTLNWNRAAVGIVRVEAEALRYFLAVNEESVCFCQFDSERKRYIIVPKAVARAVLANLDAGEQIAVLDDEIAEDQKLPHPFAVGDTYVSLGLDWDHKDLATLYCIKQRLNLSIILFCYDTIPILFPEYCVSGVPEKFQQYFVDVAWCANVVLCISEHSRSDLLTYLQNVGAPVPKLEVVSLGTEIPTTREQSYSGDILEILNTKFILFVSTIEARKNHRVLYEAYKKILGVDKKDTPLLVFVGMRGWGTDELISDIESDIIVGSYIRCLHNISDSDLAHLYENSLFTVYPSFYEGWGLPIAESLAYGKFCLASNVASLPEVGRDLIEYLPPDDADLWAERIVFYSDNVGALAAAEKKIVESYQSSSWMETGKAILEHARSIKARREGDID